MTIFGSTKVNTINMHLNTVYTSLLSAVATIFIATSVTAQCETWEGSSDKDDLENNHMFYRDALKSKDIAKAYPLWEKVFAVAPAADGKRATHYSDGRIMIKELYPEADESKQEKMFELFLDLYDQEYACYPKDKKGKDKKAYLMENKAFELYYTFNYDRQVIFDILEEAGTAAGEDLGYSIIYPYADIAVNFFVAKSIDADKAISIHKYINAVCDKNIAANGKFAAYYTQQKELANQRFESIAGDLYGCAYYVDDIKKEYDANPNDKENYTRVYNKLVDHGCTDTEPLVMEIYKKMEREVAMINEQRQEDRETARAESIANNPAYIANQAYKSGDYDTAIAKYNEALGMESDPSKQSDYHYYLAVIYGRKLNKYSEAREHVRKSTSLNSSNGKPYILLGDLYAKSARSCGKNGFEQRMVIIAAVNQWSKAKSVDSDPDVQANASKNINSYSGQLPDKEEVFLNGYKVGGSFKIGCWVGETVTIRAK